MLPSETFVPAQAEALRQYEPWYLCSRLFGPSPLAERTIVLNRGKRFNITEIAFKTTGWAPGVKQRLEEISPSLVHAHFGPDGLRVLPLAKSLGIPLVVTYHGFDATVSTDSMLRSFPAARKYARHKSEVIKHGACFIAVSKFIISRLVGQGFPEEKIQQHYIGIDTNMFHPDPMVKRECSVLFAARLVEKKGCEHLIRAMALVQEAIPDCELVLIGEGPLRKPLEQLAAQLLRKYRFLGVQKHEIVKRWMNRASVFSVPSITAESGDAEGFGMVFAEAQAMKTPVASYASGGIPEAVLHGLTGLLAPEGDYKLLANNIIQLLRDEHMRTKFALAGREHVLSNFDIRKQSAKLEDIYDKVLQSRAAGLSANVVLPEVHTCA